MTRESVPFTSFIKKGVFSTALLALLALFIIEVKPGTAAATSKHFPTVLATNSDDFTTRESHTALKMHITDAKRTAARGGFEAVARKSAVSEILKANQDLNGLHGDSFTGTEVGDPQVLRTKRSMG